MRSAAALPVPALAALALSRSPCAGTDLGGSWGRILVPEGPEVGEGLFSSRARDDGGKENASELPSDLELSTRCFALPRVYDKVTA